jgi:uncharacterized membrane protein
VGTHFADYLRMVVDTLRSQGRFYAVSFVGVLGWLDTPLGSSVAAVHGLVLLLLAVAEANPAVALSVRTRAAILAIIAASVLVVVTWLYAHWTPVGRPIIEGVQGRYFIPVAPLAGALLYNRRLRLPVERWTPAIVGYAAALLAYALYRIAERYYALG